MERLNKEQAAIISVYTGVTCCTFDHVHEYIEKLMGRPVFIHELAEPGTLETLKELSRPDFMKIVYLH